MIIRHVECDRCNDRKLLKASNDSNADSNLTAITEAGYTVVTRFFIVEHGPPGEGTERRSASSTLCPKCTRDVENVITGDTR